MVSGKRDRIYVGSWECYRDEGAGLMRHSLKTGTALIETRTQGSGMGEPEQSVRYQYADHLGSAGLELDEEGSVITFEEYYPFGSTSFQSGRSSAEVKLKRYRYTGKERDEETGFNYHGARYNSRPVSPYHLPGREAVFPKTRPSPPKGFPHQPGEESGAGNCSPEWYGKTSDVPDPSPYHSGKRSGAWKQSPEW